MRNEENKITELIAEFNEIKKIKVFEIEVTNQDKEKDFIIFNLSIYGNTLKAEHVALTKEEEESKKIAYKSIELDSCFSLDEHLQELHEECLNAIIESDFFNLAE